MNYDAIIFDLFGTLVDAYPPAVFAQVLSEIADILHLPRQEFVHVWNVDLWAARARGDFASLAETFSHICQLFNQTATDEQIQMAVAARIAYSQRTLVPRHDTLETLTQLRSSGYKIGLISDCTAEIPQLWPDTPFFALIDVALFSCVVKLKKPDPRIYHLACECLAVPAERCLYIGDGGSRELTGANAVGMDAILICVPYEEDIFHEDASWQGPRISTLKTVLNLISEV